MTKLLLFLLLITPTALYGQTIESRVAKFEKPKGYKIQYDKFKDRTLILSPIVDLGDNNKWVDSALRWQAQIAFDGKEPTGEVSYFLIFLSDREEPNFINDRGAIALVGDERMVLKEESYETQFNSAGYLLGTLIRRASYSEGLVYRITLEQLTKFSPATKIEFQVGNVEGFVNKDKLLIFKNFAGLLKH